jgi:predicted TIM-barrel fold metal-dependent hydrolase
MRNSIGRRAFLQSAIAVAAATRLRGQATVSEWGGPVLDVHLHLRQNADGNYHHIEGAGVSRAVLLSGAASGAHAKELMAAYPGRFVWFGGADVTQPDAIDRLRAALDEGAIGLGEMKSRVEAAGPEMQRVYALAAERNVPVTIHFQEVTQPGSVGLYNTGLKKFDAMLKAYPKTKFFGHADAFWANVSADYAEDTAYPTGKIKPGGVTDRLLSDFPNLYADMSANSCNNFLTRDPEFAAAFLVRHQDKLIFGSDCGCLDGRGGGAANNRCVARATLTALKDLASPAVFRKITWENGTRLLQLR